MANKPPSETDTHKRSEELPNPVQLPMNFKLFGEVEPDDLKVYIKQDVYAAIEKLAASDTSHESGSILIGNYAEDLGKTHVVVSGYIEAKYTDASASTLTFTHETWDYIHREQDRLFSDRKMVGWQHSHPGYGIFLSSYDMFIQENFFNLPFQIAYVVDPIQNIRGFFQWKSGKVEKLKGYYIYDNVGKPIRIEAPSTNAGEAVQPDAIKSVSRKLKTALICGAALFILLAGGVVYLLFGNSQLKAALNATTAQQVVLESQQTASGQVADSNSSTESDEALSNLQKQINDQQAVILDQNATIEELKKNLEILDTENASSQYTDFMLYTVQKGDTLADICKKHGIDYRANRKIMLGINGIKNANLISVGQTIIIPTYIMEQAG